MKLDRHDSLRVRSEIERLVDVHKYEKVIAKIPCSLETEFSEHGYIREASIPEYFRDGEHAVFMAKYFSAERASIVDQEKIEDVLSLALSRRQKLQSDDGDSAFTDRVCGLAEADEMAGLYRTVFDTYPFPIYRPEFLQESIQNRCSQYFCACRDMRMIAIAASEFDWPNRGVEMTDFATLPEYRGQGLAGRLLRGMETVMQREGMHTAFSIARAVSPAMNIVFAENGYSFGGTLRNNTNIASRIQSMNIWYKRMPFIRNRQPH